MIRKNLMIAAVIAAVLSQSFLFADGGNLTLDTVKEKVLSKSLSLQQQEDSLDKLKESAEDTAKIVANAKMILDLDRQLRIVSRTPEKERTAEQDNLYNACIRVLGKQLTVAQRAQYISMRDSTVLNMQYSLQMSTNAIEVTKNSLTQAAAQQYIAVLKLKDSLDLQRQLKNNLDLNYKNAQAKYKLKKITAFDLRSIELQGMLAGLQLDKAQRSFDSAVISLNNLMGEPITQKYTAYSNEGIVISTQMDTYENYLAKAMTNRADVTNAEGYQRVKANDFQVTKNSYAFDDQVENMNASYALNDAIYKLSSAKLNVQMEITTAYKELNSKVQALNSADLTYQAAKSAYDEAVIKVKLGLMNEKQLSDADISRTQSAMQLQNAKYDLWIYQMKMENACGIGPGTQTSGMGR